MISSRGMHFPNRMFTPPSAEHHHRYPSTKLLNVARLLSLLPQRSRQHCAPQDLQRRLGYTTWDDVQIASAYPITPMSDAHSLLPRLLDAARPTTAAPKAACLRSYEITHCIRAFPAPCYSYSTPNLGKRYSNFGTNAVGVVIHRCW